MLTLAGAPSRADDGSGAVLGWYCAALATPEPGPGFRPNREVVPEVCAESAGGVLMRGVSVDVDVGVGASAIAGDDVYEL